MDLRHVIFEWFQFYVVDEMVVLLRVSVGIVSKEATKFT